MKRINGNKEVFVPLLTGHAKAFDFVNYELLIAKLHAYDLDNEIDYGSPLRSPLGSFLTSVSLFFFFFFLYSVFFRGGGAGSVCYDFSNLSFILCLQ